MTQRPEDSPGDTQLPVQPRSGPLAASSVPTAAAKPLHGYSSRPLEIAESIRTLHDLHQRGGLTEEEFAHAKQQILESPSTTSASNSSEKSIKSSHRKGRRRRKAEGSQSTAPTSRGSRGHRRRSSSSSSSSSSSGSGGSCFIVVPRVKVWRTLQTMDESSRCTSPLAEEEGPAAVARSPLFFDGASSPVKGAPGYGPPAGKARKARAVLTRPPGAPKSLDGVDIAERAHVGDDNEETALLVRDPDSGRGLSSTEPLPTPHASGAGGSGLPSPRDERRAYFTLEGGGRPPSANQYLRHSFEAGDPLHHSSLGEKHKYGTFFKAAGGVGVGVGKEGGGTDPFGHGHAAVELEPEHEVRVRYYNSRGRSGDRFSEVKLREDELRQPFFLHNGASAVLPAARSAGCDGGGGGGSGTGAWHASPSLPTAESQVFAGETVPPLTVEENKAWAEMGPFSSSSSRSRRSSSSSSFLEQSLNWYWIDVTGRDPTRRRYNSALRFLTRRFTICESFLVDRDHILMLPQIVESPDHPGQFLLNLRVASHRISISDDSVMELTNRWIIIVDLRQHFVLTLHRVDTHSMAQLRSQWKRIMSANEVSFPEFLLKIIDDALHTYELSLDVHTDLLDRCESKLFASDSSLQAHDSAQVTRSRSPANPGDAAQLIDMRILHHFAHSSRSAFLRQLLDVSDRRPVKKSEMNSFLHHLHRRTSVQHRMLNATQTVLQKAFTKLQLCSRELAGQMCSNCIELSGRALEVRDDAKTLLDLHISLQSFRTNELMAVLTRVSLLFTPCTFLAGVYGMNFRIMPELDWHWGYPYFWVVCIAVGLVMQRIIFRF